MTHRARARVHFVTGGPAWQNPSAAGFTKQQIAARKPLLKLMGQLGPAVKRRDGKLADNLTVEERKHLWKYKQRIVAGESRDRREGKKPPSPGRPVPH